MHLIPALPKQLRIKARAPQPTVFSNSGDIASDCSRPAALVAELRRAEFNLNDFVSGLAPLGCLTFGAHRTETLLQTVPQCMTFERERPKQQLRLGRKPMRSAVTGSERSGRWDRDSPSTR